MKINGAEEMTVGDVQSELAKGGRFVVFRYCISILIMTFKRNSNIYFVRDGECTFGMSIGYTFVSFLLGWWGIPWGPIHTIGAISTNLRGGKDVTKEVMAVLNPAPVSPSSPCHLTATDLAKFTFRQRFGVKQSGYLLTPEDAEEVGQMLAKFKDKDARKFSEERGVKVTFSE